MAKSKGHLSEFQDFPGLVGKIISPDVKHLSNNLLAEINEEEFSAIKGIVGGTIATVDKADIGKAILALVQRESSPAVTKILLDVLADQRMKLHDRVIAANSLSLMPPKIAEEALIGQLSIGDPLIQNSVIRSLGIIGGENALEHLVKISQPDSLFLKKQLSFSKALIAHRLNLPEDFLPFKKGKERRAEENTQLIQLSLRLAGGEKIKNMLNVLNGGTYNIEISNNFGFELIAGKASWAVLINKDLQGNKIFSDFSKRKMITGLLARKNKSTNYFTVQYVILSNPKGGEIEIMVVRTDGEIFYSGKAQLGAGIMNFSMHDIDRQGTAPTNVKGSLTDEGVALSLKIPFGNRINKQQGESILVT